MLVLRKAEVGLCVEYSHFRPLDRHGSCYYYALK